MLIVYIERMMVSNVALKMRIDCQCLFKVIIMTSVTSEETWIVQRGPPGKQIIRALLVMLQRCDKKRTSLEASLRPPTEHSLIPFWIIRFLIRQLSSCKFGLFFKEMGSKCQSLILTMATVGDDELWKGLVFPTKRLTTNIRLKIITHGKQELYDDSKLGL